MAIELLDVMDDNRELIAERTIDALNDYLTGSRDDYAARKLAVAMTRLAYDVTEWMLAAEQKFHAEQEEARADYIAERAA